MQYEPLDKTKNEIRVLEFLDLSSPVSTEDIIQCSVRNVSLPSSFDSQTNQEDPQDREYPTAWDKFTKSVDLRDSTLEQRTLDAATHARLHRSPPQCSDSRYNWGDFEALSYTWGNTADTKIIYVNGVRKHVPRNLEEALRALRSLEETLLGMRYWIDSLCIDQENIEERNEQVKRMKEIYSRARAVIVWLGQEDEMDRIAIQKMHYPCHGVDTTLQSPFDELLHEWLTIFAFVHKPYWSRCWIIQELAMNHNSTLFLCGESKLTRGMIRLSARQAQSLLRRFEKMNHRYDHKLQIEAWAKVEHMECLIDITPVPDVRRGLNSTLELIRRADATDERDKIYSILGLLDPAISRGVTPNYSLSVQQVYTNFMKSVINASNRLDYIALANTSAEEGWPSWVPDWRKPLERHYTYQMMSQQCNRAIPAKFRFIEKEKDRTDFACSGFHVDTVDGLATEPPLGSYAAQSGNACDRYNGQTFEAIKMTFCMGDSRMPMEPLFEIPWSLSRDLDDNVLPNPKWVELSQSTYFERWDNFRKCNADFCIGGQKFRTLFAQSDEQSVDTTFTVPRMRSALVWLDQRALITTSTGYVGLAPVETCPGDVVAILLGCCWPVVLRPCDDGLYRVIGECYIAGLMEGEILDQQRDGHVLEQEFILC